ncbi:ImmA/IrrE family metallo-endopeptidase [bacterium]|nr:ImmA/IrrE family metallo-endopeptidase [bacterium]
MVRDHEDVEAWAVAARLCLDIPVRLDPSGAAQVEFAEVTRDDGIAPLRRQYARCRHLRSDAEVGAFVSWFNAEHDDCRLEIVGSGATREIVPGPGCAPDAAITGKIARAKVMTVKVNAPWVIVHSGITRVAMTPDQQAFVIAHELAHYYRAHYARSLRRYLDSGGSHEAEADELATEWIAALGFDPLAGVAFFENYMRLFPESAGARQDTAHPDPCVRAENIARVAADLR